MDLLLSDPSSANGMQVAHHRAKLSSLSHVYNISKDKGTKGDTFATLWYNSLVE
jgi:hypothetical protein